MTYLPARVVCFLCILSFSFYCQAETDYLTAQAVNTADLEKSGFIFDLRVANMPYQSERIIGQTSSHGEFVFLDGETITFSLGNYQFKPVKADQYLSIFKFIESENAVQSVRNLTRLLQVIDANPEKMTIVLPNLAGIDLADLNFNQSATDFSNDLVIVTLLNTLGHQANLLNNSNVNNHVYSMVSLFQFTN